MKIKNFALSVLRSWSLFLLSSLLVFLLSAPKASAQLTNSWTDGYCVQNDVATIQGFQCLIANVLSVFIPIIGLTAFVVIIAASFKYMLAGSNSKNVEESRKMITYAIIGIVVALSAVIIMSVLSAFVGIDLTRIWIPDSNQNFGQ